MRYAATGAVVLCAAQATWLGTCEAEGPGSAGIAKELSKQEAIYRSEGQGVPEGYTTDRSLSDYTEMLSAGFDQALARLGPNDRWLDIGAGQAGAMLDYFTATSYHKTVQPEGRRVGKAHVVALSIEDRRTQVWKITEARLGSKRMRYLSNKRLKEYSQKELGQFQLITDVIGGFSYADDLSLFIEKVIGFLTLHGSFYTVLQDVRSEEGKNRPYYTDSPFSTAITGPDGAEVSVCSWLRSITCVEVVCEPKEGWQPPIEAFRVRKLCNDVRVPSLVLVHYEAATPPGRQYRGQIPGNSFRRPSHPRVPLD